MHVLTMLMDMHLLQGLKAEELEVFSSLVTALFKYLYVHQFFHSFQPSTARHNFSVLILSPLGEPRGVLAP